MTVTCYKCGQPGHVSSECKWGRELSEGDSRPDWCGACDRRTRLVLVTTTDGEKAMRCPDCHPLGGKIPKQFTRCPGCRTAIYVWDNNDCGRHQAIGARLSYHPMPDVRQHPADHELAARQVAESRAARAVLDPDLPGDPQPAFSLPLDAIVPRAPAPPPAAPRDSGTAPPAPSPGTRR